MRTLLIADVHANLPALSALPEADRVVCAGDLVGYGPHPARVLAALRAMNAVCVRGDEDDAVGYGTEHVAPPTLERACRESREWTRRALDAGDLAFLRNLPPEAEVEIEGVRIAAIHAYPGDYERYIEPSDEQLDRIARAFPRANVIVLGHTHRPAVWSVRRKLIVNPGSVGQPARAGYASYAILEHRAVRLGDMSFNVIDVLHDMSTMPLGSVAREQNETAIIHGGVRPRDRVARPAARSCS